MTAMFIFRMLEQGNVDLYDILGENLQVTPRNQNGGSFGSLAQLNPSIQVNGACSARVLSPADF